MPRVGRHIRTDQHRAGVGERSRQYWSGVRAGWWPGPDRTKNAEAAKAYWAKVKAPITREQRRVWVGIANGLELKQIATERGVSVKTVEFHRTQLCRRLGCPGANNVQLCRLALREGVARL